MITHTNSEQRAMPDRPCLHFLMKETGGLRNVGLLLRTGADENVFYMCQQHT